MKTIQPHVGFGDFNDLPHGFKFIPTGEFSLRFFMYSIDKEIFRQPRCGHPDTFSCLNDGEFFGSIRMFTIKYKGCEENGYGIAQIHFKNMKKETELRYFQFGKQSNFDNLLSRMAAQFANDNS